MSAMSLLLNVLWIVFGGLWMAVAWIVAAVLMAVTIVGLPWTRAAFNIAAYTLFPFGQQAIRRRRTISPRTADIPMSAGNRRPHPYSQNIDPWILRLRSRI